MSKIYRTIIVILTLIIGFQGYRQIKLNSINPATTYRVANVLDGDTFVTEENHQKIRLYGIDAPNLKYPYGEESKEFLSSLIQGKQVYFKNIMADKFGRILALVYVDDLLINETMLLQGYAENDGHKIALEPNLLKDAEALAKKEQLGIFGKDITQTENIENPKCIIKGNIRRGIKTYMYPGCGSYTNTIVEKHKGDTWFCSEKEAKKAGFLFSNDCFSKSF